jgi:hypothetical protein
MMLAGTRHAETWVRKIAGFNFDVIGRVIIPVRVPRLNLGRARRYLFKYYLLTKLKSLTYCLKL